MPVLLLTIKGKKRYTPKIMYSYSAQKKLSAFVFVTAVIIAVTSGCASLPSAKSFFTSEHAEKRRRRNEEIVQNFETHRDQAAYEAAKARWEQNDSKGCREALDRLLVRNPRHIDAQLLLAEVNLLDKRPQDALKQIDNVLGMQPNNARALYTKGLVLDAIGQSTGALAYYEQAARAEPENEMYALCYKNAKDSDGSVENSPDAVIQVAYQGPAMPDKTTTASMREQGPALTSLAARQHVGDAPSTAMPAADTFDKTAKNSGFADSYVHAESVVSAEECISDGQRALSDGAVDAARIAFHKAIANQPNNPQIPIVSAGAALRANHPELAVELLTPASKHFSKSAAIFRILGVAYYRLGNYQSSQVALQQALSLDKSSALSYFLMGCTLAKLGQAESAEAHYKQAQALDPRYTVRR
jgi:tetratricopeptide (TPR) repeat protein